MSRAIWALLQLDFKGYITYNFMTIFVVVSILIIFNSEYLEKYKKIKGAAYIVLVVNFIYYCARLFLYQGDF
jgi:hypothetical protein